ncbi:hypothetical protein [Paenibacillus sp. GCM10027626]|uniref:hypothetical protein n=1 Tax=Paenibacillus sp. GCM10027626 TaxID=3273411 RepID=UPI00363F9B9B
MMQKGKSYPLTPPTHPEYEYVGYKKTTTGEVPSGEIISGAPPGFTYNGNFNTFFLIHYYKKKDVGAGDEGLIKIRHMVREGSSGTFKLKEEKSTVVTALPVTRYVEADSSYGTPLGGSVSYTGYTDNRASTTRIAVTLDKNQKTGYVSFFYESSAANSFTGNFDIIPDTIDYGDPFTLHPKDYELKGCTYISHSYKITKQGSTFGWTGADIFGQHTDSNFTRVNYPSVISVGTFVVSMKIKTSCGEKWVAEKPLVVKDPKNNQPPQFQIGFVNPNVPTKVLNEAIEDSILDLTVIFDPTVPTPYDPDGDTIHFDQFFFAESGSAFIRSLPSKYPVHEWAMNNIKMDTRGFHQVCAQVRDDWGATATACTYINIVPKNPVPIIDCPKEVIENHPVPDNLFKSNRSYSPLQGRTIDHSRDEWTNKKSFYKNGTDKNIVEIVSLHVYDNTGLKSLEPATCQIVVKPDLPPIAKLDVPKLAIRNEPTVILNKSYSPDGDEIVKAEYKYKYDAKNNGFADDNWKTIDGTLESLTINPDKVGKYLFYVKVTEAYGQSGDTAKTSEAILTMDVVNNAPEVSFEVEGKNLQPDLNASTTIRTDTMMGWPVYVPNTTEQVFRKNDLWTTNGGGSLAAGSGQNFGDNRFRTASSLIFGGNGSYAWYMPPQQDLGFGANNLSPWRSMTTLDENQLLLDVNNRPFYVSTYSDYKVRSNKKLVYFHQRDTSGSFPNVKRNIRIYALDPTKLSPVEMYSEGWGLLYRYKNGSPYAFTIADWYSATDQQWEVAGRYIYVGSRPESGDTTKSTITVYDAFTGKKIKEAEMPFWTFIGARGDKLLMGISSWGSKVGEEFGTYYEVSPDLSVKKLTGWTVPAPRASFVSPSNSPYMILEPMYFDPQGNSYVYGGFRTGNNHSYYDLNVTKYDVNMNMVWRRYLTDPQVWTAPFSGGAPGLVGQYSTLYYPKMEINTFAGELTVPVYEGHPNDPYMSSESLYALDMKTGAIKRYYDGRGSSGTGMNKLEEHRISWDGSMKRPLRQTTAEGYSLETKDWIGASGCTWVVRDSQDQEIMQKSGCFPYTTYYQDGFMISLQEYFQDSSNLYMFTVRGKPSTAPLVRQMHTNGQFMSNITLSDAEMKYSFRMENIDFDNEVTGLSFRMKDTKNRYAVESDGHSFELVKYVGGVRTVLKASNYPFQSDKSYAVRIKTVGKQIDVILNNIPVISVTDGSFKEGKFGYFSNKAYVYFSAFTYKPVKEIIEWSDSFAIWDEGTATAEVAYKNIEFLDPENDPKAGSYNWTIEHTPRFINNQGVSAKHSKTFSSEQLTFDKVGDYIVTLQAKDDPHPNYRYPDMTFDEYRKLSNAFKKKVTVHRRPVSQFTVKQAADGKVIWTDTSYDPDRYESIYKYSAENTGIDYKATRGILERKYYYMSPSGTIVEEKLVAPQEKGLYEIGMAVKDEYNAWSDYTVVSLDVAKTATPNTPPVPGFTTSYINTYRNVPITINSTAYDKEDGGRENLPHEYYIRNVTTGGGETLQSTSRTSWTKTFNTLGTFNIRQRVQDSAGAEAQFSRQVNIVNRLPVAQILVPDSNDQNKPTKLKELRPEFKWSYYDTDGDPQTRFQLRIYKYGGVQLLDTDVRPGSGRAWRPAVDLPEKVNLYVMVRVFDGYDWGVWSDPKFFYIETNQPPTADFDWQPKPVYEGDTITLRANADDADRDRLTMRYRIVDPSGKSSDFNYEADHPYSINEPEINAAKPGQYSVELIVSDGKADPVIVQKTIQVLPLTVSGEVKHTELWDERRKASNKKISGNEEQPRSYDMFWAGEKFVLYAGTTKTAGATKATRVEVKMGEYSTRLIAADTSASQWKGELWDKQFEQLSDGPLTFTFIAYYSNGIVKQTTATIQIAGNVNAIAGVHRRQ